MTTAALNLLVAAAKVVVPSRGVPEPRSYATWRETRWDDEFDPELTTRYLCSEGEDVTRSLLEKYDQLQMNRATIQLREITTIAPWIDCLAEPFVDYASFGRLRENPRYIQIITFTTPAISDDGAVGFLEVWTEDGRYSQMGFWWWLQMRSTNGRWVLDWKNMYAIS